MKNNGVFFVILVILIGIAMVVADFLILLFFGHSFSRIIVRFGVPALAFVAVYSLILGRDGKCFGRTYFQNSQEYNYAERLKKIGAVPIKMIGLSVVFHAAFLGVVFFNNEYLDIAPEIHGPLYLVALAFGMVGGVFLYVICDGLVSRTLSGHNLVLYPRDLRENRQAVKSMIIPVAVTLVALTFACSVTLLGVRLAGGNLDDMQGSAWSMILIPVIVFFVFITILALNLRKNTSALYTSVIEELENLSSDRKDLTKLVSVCSVDELGTIAGMVNTFCDQLGSGIREIKDGQKQLSSVAARLEENASGMASSVTQISSSVGHALSKTQDQKESTNNSSLAIQKITSQIKALEESIDIQTSSMNQASASVEEMIGNITSIGTVTEKMTAQFKTVEESAVKGNQVQQESGERIRIVVEQSQALQEANRIIATIAAQTNLLAMNAAIEAAHAGDLGRGFAVVSDEIRKLAENSSNESKKIGSELKQIVTTIDKVVQDANASMKAFTEVSALITETEKLVHQVDNAIHEQKTGAGQVLDALRTMKDVTAKVRNGSEAIDMSNESMTREIDILQNSAGEILTNMEEMSGGIKNINTGAQEISGLATATQSSIQKISAIANGFEV